VKTNPNKANLPEGKIDTMCVFTKDYDKEQRTINNERYSKQTQIKANFKGKKMLSVAEIICSAGSAFGFGSRLCSVAHT